MTLRQLQHFVSVAEALNFRRAAGKVNLTQQAISKSILHLEKQLGVRLLERGRQSVMLTATGRDLLPFAIEVLSAMHRFDEAVAAATGQAAGVLCVGASPTFLESVIPEALDAFQQRHPETPVTVERGDFAILSAAMLRGELDMVLTTMPTDFPRHLFRASPLGTDRNVIVVRRDHPLSREKRVSAADLQRFPQVATINYPRGQAYLERLFLAEGLIPPRPRLSVGSTLLAIDRVEQTDAWWVAPQLQVARRIIEGRFVVLPVLEPDESWAVIVATRRHAATSRWAASFMADIERCLGEVCPALPPR